MILREINKPVFDSWHSQKFPTPKRLYPYLGSLIQGLQGSCLDGQVSWALGCRIPFTADVKSEWSCSSVPPTYLNGVDRTMCNMLCCAAHSGSSVGRERGGTGGSRMCLSFTCQPLADCKSTGHRADGSGTAAAVHSVVILADNFIRPLTPPLHGNYKQVRSYGNGQTGSDNRRY